MSEGEGEGEDRSQWLEERRKRMTVVLVLCCVALCCLVLSCVILSCLVLEGPEGHSRGLGLATLSSGLRKVREEVL